MSADRLRLFYTDSSLIEESSARIEGDEAAHLARVLRLQPGDQCRIATELGEEYLVELTNVSAKKTQARILERLPARPASSLTVTLGLPLIKGDRFEWVLEKGTELGADRFESGRFELAARLFDQLIHQEELEDFLTLVAYREL